MADTLFVDATSTVPGTPLVAAWHNDVNTATYDRLTGVAGTNTITATGPSSMTAYAAGQNFYLVPAITNTGAVTLNVSSLGAKAVTKNGTTPLVAGDMVAGTMYEVSYDGTQFQLINPTTVSGANITGSIATATLPAANITGQLAIANGGTGASTASQALINLGATGRLIAVQAFSASGTYTPTAGMNSVIVEAVGGGGAGGGAPATGASQVSAGGGGGSGAYTRGRFVAPGSQTITIGTAGVGGAGAGGSGGTTSFGALLTAPGGSGGTAGVPVTANRQAGGAGGVAGTGGNIIASAGNPGGNSYAIQPFSTTTMGGVSHLVAFGRGGTGAGADASSGAVNGGNGTAGYLIVYEFS